MTADRSFRCNVCYCIECQKTRGFPPVPELLGEAEVCHLDVSLLCQHEVLRLQISVHYVLRVDVIQSRDDLRSVETRHTIRESSELASEGGQGKDRLPGCPEVAEQLSSRDELHHHVQTARVDVCSISKLPAFLFKGGNSQFDNEGVAEFGEDVLLVVDVGDLSRLYHFVHIESLQGKELSVLLVFSQLDATKGTRSCKGCISDIPSSLCQQSPNHPLAPFV